MEAAGQHIIEVKTLRGKWNLYAIGDVHLGNRGCAKGRFREVVRTIQNDRRGVWIGLGDFAEYISITDPRFDATVVDPDLFNLASLGNAGEANADAFVREAECIKSKCIGLAYGNHEAAIMSRGQNLLHDHVCARLGVRNLKYSAFIDLVFRERDNHRKRRAFRLAVHHGAGAAGTTGGKINRLEKFMDMYEADIILTGHTHAGIDSWLSTLGANAECTKLVSINKLGLICGTYLKTYKQGVVGYGEKKGYRPARIGSPKIIISLASRKLGTEWEDGDAE